MKYLNQIYIYRILTISYLIVTFQPELGSHLRSNHRIHAIINRIGCLGGRFGWSIARSLWISGGGATKDATPGSRFHWLWPQFASFQHFCYFVVLFQLAFDGFSAILKSYISRKALSISPRTPKCIQTYHRSPELTHSTYLSFSKLRRGCFRCHCLSWHWTTCWNSAAH